MVVKLGSVFLGGVIPKARACASRPRSRAYHREARARLSLRLKNGSARDDAVEDMDEVQVEPLPRSSVAISDTASVYNL